MSTTVELIKTFCSMHLAVNFEKYSRTAPLMAKTILWYMMSFTNYMESAVLQNTGVEVVLMTFCQ